MGVSLKKRYLNRFIISFFIIINRISFAILLYNNYVNRCVRVSDFCLYIYVYALNISLFILDYLFCSVVVVVCFAFAANV